MQKLAEYTRIYHDDLGDSHLETISVDCKADREATSEIKRSTSESATNFTFIEAPRNWNYEWHNAPRRQYVLLFGGEIELETSDGEVKHLFPGAVIFAEDTQGKGHITRSVGNTSVVLGIVPITD